MKQFSPLTIYIFSIKQESRVNKQKGTTFHILLSICTKLAKSRHTAYVVYQYTYNILVGSVSCCCCSRFQPSKSPPHHSKEELAQSVGVLQPPPPPTTTTSCFLFDEQTLKWREAGNIGKIVLKASRNLKIQKCLQYLFQFLVLVLGRISWCMIGI